ncbi:MAG: STAS domain-containing protein [Xenococcaceae cyanobacterium MO_207.B15]|nr:STAS domain-containing protein [Xenococcaceae cyanobacterium MO_207.B15]MDJ0745401.1 STAS domain-containing protein [Xenococcaceae cyanobacterium MO_167.B27]
MNSQTLNCQFATFEPQGYVSAANVREFLQELTDAVENQTDSALLVDMASVEFMDSAGLMALIKGFNLAQDLQRRFSICSVPPSVRMVFELTQLDKVFEIFESKDSFTATIV